MASIVGEECNEREVLVNERQENKSKLSRQSKGREFAWTTTPLSLQPLYIQIICHGPRSFDTRWRRESAWTFQKGISFHYSNPARCSGFNHVRSSSTFQAEDR